MTSPSSLVKEREQRRSNTYTAMVGSVLQVCLKRQVEIGKISELILCLYRCGVSIYSPLVREGIAYIHQNRLSDGMWSTPLVSAQCMEILSGAGNDINCYADNLCAWSTLSLWGQNTRDIPRLACSAEIIECLLATGCAVDAQGIVQSISKLWGRDIGWVPYSFKAISYLFIRAQLFAREPGFLDSDDMQLLDKTLEMICSTLQKYGYITTVLNNRPGRCALHFVINLYKAVYLLENYNNGNLSYLREKVRTILLTYADKEPDDFDSTDLCDYCIISQLID